MRKTLNFILKVIGLIILLVFLYFIESLIFWMIFGEGAQASTAADKWSTRFVMYISPLIIVIVLAYRMFKKK